MAEPHSVLNTLPLSAAREALTRCCGAQRWVEAMLARRPFSSTAQLLEASDAVTATLTRADQLEAFSHHPPIGADLAELQQKFASTAGLSSDEQAGAHGVDVRTLEALRDQNRAYAQRFGYIFIVCATGKSAAEMLALLEQRLTHAPDLELRVAAGEQAKIAKLRLEKIA